MQEEELRESLEKLLITLKNNRERVELPLLKTKYRNAYRQLCNEICQTTEWYIKSISLREIRIPMSDDAEVSELLNPVIKRSGLLKEISRAAFIGFDIEEIKKLAEELREQIKQTLQPYYAARTGLLINPENMEDTPLIYNELTGRIFENGHWMPYEIKMCSILILIQGKEGNK